MEALNKSILENRIDDCSEIISSHSELKEYLTDDKEWPLYPHDRPKSLLHLAAYYGRHEILSMFIEQGANVNLVASSNDCCCFIDWTLFRKDKMKSQETLLIAAIR